MAKITKRDARYRVSSPPFTHHTFDIELSEVRKVGTIRALDGLTVSVMLDDPEGGPPLSPKEKAIRVLEDALAALKRWEGR
jgi:hypothetical protein